MVKFVKLENGDYVNLEKITVIAATPDSGWLHFSDRDYLRITKNDVDNILKASKEAE